MKNCKVCGTPKSRYVLNNRLVCLKCDELVFDLEIECDEENNPIKNKLGDKTQVETGVKKVIAPAKK